MSLLPPKIDAGSDANRILRQHTREIASWARTANSVINSLTVTQGGLAVAVDIYASAVTAAANGQIPATAQALSTAGYATVGDEGAAVYAWQASAPSWSASDPSGLLYFPDLSARGGYWVLNEDDPHAAMAGVFGDATGTEPTTDCAAGLNTLLTYAYERRGGGTVRLSHRNYLCSDHITLPKHTGILGALSTGRVFESPDGEEGIEGLPFQPGLVLASGKSIKVNAGFTLENLSWRRAGLTQHTDLEGALDFQAAGLSGTGVTKAGGGDLPSGTIRNCAAYGFAFGAHIDKGNGLVVDTLYGDCATLLACTRSGESIRLQGIARKPVLGNNDAIGIVRLTVTALSDDGGFVRFTCSDDLPAVGLTNGQRLAADKIPDASTTSERRTVSNVTTNAFTLVDCPWDAAYATWTADEIAAIKFAFAPGQSSAVLTFANDGGYVRVTTQVAFPFAVGHFALLGAPGNAARGFHQIRTVHSTTDFTLERAWDAGLATIDVTLCELAAMPKNRRHSSAVTSFPGVTAWGTTEGYALAVIDCDGSYITGRFKGGSGLYCDAALAKIYLTGNEGGAAGEIELNDPDTHGVYIAGTRCTIFGMASKSNGTSLTVNQRKQSDSFTAIGMELVGDGRALYEQISGSATLINCAVRGSNQTVLLQDIGWLSIIDGEITPAMIDASNAAEDIERCHFIQTPGTSSANARIRRHTSNSHEWWTNEGGTLTKILTLDSAGDATFTGDVIAANLPAAVNYTATTSGTTTQALTSTGTATAGTVSGYSIGTNHTIQKLRIEIVAQESGARECAYWDLTAILSRGSPASQTVLTRTAGLSGITPTDYYDNSGTDPSTWAVTLSNSSQNLIIDATGSAGRTLNWKATITVVQVT